MFPGEGERLKPKLGAEDDVDCVVEVAVAAEENVDELVVEEAEVVEEVEVTALLVLD